MTPETLLEILQWLVLTGCVLMLMACYRQLGLIVLEGRDIYRESFGPRAGQFVPRTWRSIFDSSREWYLLAMTQEGCPACQDLYDTIESTLTPFKDRVACLILLHSTSGGAEDAMSLARRFGDIPIKVEVFGDKVPGVPVPDAYPMTFLWDRGGVLREKTLGNDLSGAVSLLANTQEGRADAASTQ
jgi:hypothetical protein